MRNQYYERRSVIRMIEYLNEELHSIFLSNFILTEQMKNMPISIIVDESTHSNGVSS